jgi:hypothetical protein
MAMSRFCFVAGSYSQVSQAGKILHQITCKSQAMWKTQCGKLAGGAITILKNMSSSRGRMTSIMENKSHVSHVPNPQPVNNKQ